MFALYGTPLSLAAAAVFSYRVFQLGLPILLGGACLPTIRRQIAAGPSPEVVARYAEYAEPALPS
jgi:uncharacterized membrane protein YbhN (UPF0104 family)